MDVKIVSLPWSSTVVVDEVLSYGRIVLGGRELVPPSVEYRSNRRIAVSWTGVSSWEIGNLSLRRSSTG